MTSSAIRTLVRRWGCLATMCMCPVTSHAGSHPDLSVTATVSPSASLQPGSTGTIELTVVNVGNAPALQAGFHFAQEFRGAGTPHINLESTRPPCESAAFIAEPLPGNFQATGLSGIFGRLEPGQSATCTADFSVPAGVFGVTAVQVGASDLADTHYSNNSVLLTLILGGVVAPAANAPAVVPHWNEAGRWATIVLVAIVGLVASRLRRRSP